MAKKPGESVDLKDTYAAIDHINKTLGKKCEGAFSTYSGFMKANEESEADSVIPTGIPELDEASGIGGLKRGRIVELFGTESGGKSYICYKTIASCQKLGGTACLVDLEQSFTPAWPRSLGIDLDRVVYINKMYSMEWYLQCIVDMASSGKFDLIVIDSTAAFVPKAELEGEVGDQFIGLQARVLSQALRKLIGVLEAPRTNGKKPVVIFINQIREKPGVMWGNPETTPGGRALKFFAHMRLDIRKKKTEKIEIDGEDVPIAQISGGTFVKNKLATPQTKFEITISFKSSFNNPLTMLAQLACKYKLFGKRSGIYSYKPEDRTEKPTPTDAGDPISLACWIHEQGLVAEVVLRVTTALEEEKAEIPDFISQIDEETAPPIRVEKKKLGENNSAPELEKEEKAATV